MRKFVAISFVGLLLAAIAMPLMATTNVSATDESSTPVSFTSDGQWSYINTSDGQWSYIKNDFITIAFPANGTKPMFLWWYTSDPNNINVVKFKGLIEYLSYLRPYFLWRCQADGSTISNTIESNYYSPMQHMNDYMRMHVMSILSEMDDFAGLHRPYLPFSGSTWRLDGPENVTAGNVQYLSFNFTLVNVPEDRPNFHFADGNVILRARFYYTPAMESVYGKYSYSVNAGELKIDLVINHWVWNIDTLQPLINELRDMGVSVPQSKTGLALWVNLASINMTGMHDAEDDAQSGVDVDLTEGASMAHDMYVEGGRVSVTQNETSADEIPLQNRFREGFRIRFETGNATFAGFFKFVPQAIVTNGADYKTVDVTASYVSAGAHIRLFIGYPYFGNNSLEHDPSLGLENVTPWLPMNLLLVIVGATAAIAIAFAAIRMRKKPVNIVTVQ